jgi:hypothetical protein
MNNKDVFNELLEALSKGDEIHKKNIITFLESYLERDISEIRHC